MSTKIEWTDETWNPVTGCSKISQGCKNCYAMREWPRLAGNPKTAYFGREFTDVRCHPERLDQPLRWSKPRRIFVNSMSDLFHPDVPDDFIDRVFAVMALSPQHTFQVLTKRPERMRAYMNHGEGFGRWGFIDGRARQIYAERYRAPFPTGKVLLGPLPNVWLGVSVEDQAAADERIPLLLETPAAVRWISAEPLLGPINLESVLWPNKGGHRVDVLRAGYWNAAGYRYGGPSAELGAERGLFTNHSDMARLDWVVAGGESGPNARPMHPDWARGLCDQCVAAGVPFLFKQWGEWAPRRPESERDGLDGATNLPAIDMWPCGYIARDGAEFRARPASTDNVLRQAMWRVGKKAAGRLLDGAQYDGYP